MTDEVDRLENNGLEIDGQKNDGRNETDEKLRTDVDRPEFAGLENDGLVDHGL